MITIVQRVSEASVTVQERVVGRIGPGMLALAAIIDEDGPREIEWTAGKLAGMRIFRDGEKHFHKDVREAGGSILLVSNFTIAAATRQGRRPSFDRAADPEIARPLFDQLIEAVRRQGVHVETGIFGAEMKVHLVNDGPATFIVES